MAVYSCINGHPMTEQDQTCPVCGTVPTLGGIMPPTAAVLPTIPGYDIAQELGHGGMGVVYKARHRELQRWVALKMIRNWGFAGAEEQARFRTEAQAIAQLQHAHIVQIFQIGDWQGMPFLSLEFIEGGTLEKKLAGQPMAPREAAGLLRQIAKTVAFAHQQGILHRDLKPSNIFLTASGEPKIGDFGLAKRMDAAPGLTQPDEILGTPCYMAPEQAQRQNQAIGPAADLYALGVILYQMLTGRPPFLGATALETLQQVLEQEPVPPRRLQPGVPGDLETICLKCLRKDPRQRYAGAAELAQDLEAFEQGKPIQARPVGRLEVVWRWCRRNPLPAALSALSLFLFTVGFGLVTWKWQEAELATEAKKTALSMQEDATKQANEAALATAAALVKQEAATSKAKEAALATAAALKESKAFNAQLNESLQREEQAFRKLEQDSYRSAVRTAHRVWEEGNVLLADKLLLGINPDLRRWEWDFLRNLQRSSAIATYRHFNTNRTCVAYSPDGANVAYIGSIRSLYIRDAKTGKLIKRLDGHTKQINCLAFSTDGSILAAGDDDSAIILWHWRLETPKKTMLEKLPGKITCVSLSGDGKLAFGWTKGYAVRSLSEPTRQDRDLLWDAERSEFANLAFSSNSRFLVTGQRDGSLQYKDLRNPRASIPLVNAHGNNCVAVTFSPGDDFLISGGGDGLVKVWDTRQRHVMHTFEGNIGMVTCVAVDPAGQWLASGSVDHVIRVWNLEKGTERAVLRGHASAVTSLSFSPKQAHVGVPPSGGAHLASSSLDHTVRLWDLAITEGAAGVHTNPKASVFFAVASQTQRLFMAETAPKQIWSHELNQADPFAWKQPVPISLDALRTLQQLAVSADGQWMALAGTTAAGTQLLVWNTQTQAKKATLDSPSNNVLALAFHPKQPHLLASADKDGGVILWHVDDPAKKRMLEGFKAEVSALAFSPDGRWLAAGGKESDKRKRIRIWDLEDIATVQPANTLAANGAVLCLAFSPDGQHLAFWGGADSFASAPIEVVEWKSAETIATLEGRRQNVFGLAFHPRGNRLLSAGDDNFLRLWDLDTSSELVHWPSRHRIGYDTRLAFSADGRFALSSSRDSVCLWDGTCRHERWMMTGHKNRTFGVAFSPDGKRIVSGGEDHGVRLWDPKTGQEFVDACFPLLKAHTGKVNSVAFHPGGGVFASASADKTAILWNAHSGKKLLELKHAQSVRWVAFSPDGKMLVTASNDRTCKLWDPETGAELRTLEGHDKEVNTAAFNQLPKSPLLASCSVDGTVRLWNPITGKQERSLQGHGVNVTDVAFSRDDAWLASGDLDGWIIIWDPATGAKKSCFQAHNNTLESLAFHPRHAHLLFSVANDGLIHIWDVRNIPADSPRAQSLATLRGHSGAVIGLAISPDGKRLATTGADHTVRVWDLDFLDNPTITVGTRVYANLP